MSGTAALEPSSSRPSVSRRATGLLGLASLVACVFIAGAALPYFGLEEAQFGTFWPRRWWLLFHISGGMAALLAGPVQFWLGLTDQHVQVHRRLGTAYVICVALSALAGYYLAFQTDGGWLYGAGFAGLASAWIATTGMAYVAARRFLFDQHKEWMIRSYVVTFAFVTFRILYPAVQAIGVGTPSEPLAFAAWACWAVPLVATEAILQGRKIFAAAI